MDRRTFLLRSSSFLAGSILGLSSFSEAFGADKTSNPPKVAIIIDDIGYSRSHLRNFLEIGTPITFAVLPKLAATKMLSEEIHDQGHEIILHQPMEPFNPNIDPGPGAVYVGDNPDKIVNIIGENISDIPYVTGINNHMGSKFTASLKEVEDALFAIKLHGLFFIDSLTTSRSKAYETAKRLNMATARRNIFLDNRPQEPSVLSQLDKLKSLAIRSGYGIGIGHPYPETARAINSFLKGLSKQEISMVYISCLINA